MNPLPPNADELVSAYLDGEATPDEINIVESNTELMSRADALRAISAQLGAPHVPPAGQKEAHISAALDAFDDLFANNDPSLGDTSLGDTSLAAVPPARSPVDGPASFENPKVASLDTARERRRPRRFNIGVIAAAAAVMLMFVAAAALSFGRGNSSDDVATSADSAASAEVAGDEDFAELSNDDEAAMSDEGSRAADGSALSELDSAAQVEQPPLPTAGASTDAAPPAAVAEAPEEEAAAAMDSDEDAMDESEDAMDDAGAAGDEATEPELELTGPILFFGRFDNRAELKAGIELDELETTIDELLERASEFEAGIIPSCRDEIPELAETEPDQVLAEAFLEDEGLIVAEIYVLTDADGTRDIYVVDRADCSLISLLLDQ